MGCPSDGELLAFAAGAVTAEVRRDTDAHLDGCPDCLAAIALLVRSSGGPHVDVDLASPQVLADGGPRYLLDREIARGGMGRILAAHDRLLDRPVALKLLRAHDPGLARRFLRERLITARLQHPAIVPIYDAGTLDGGEPFFAMRMVSGKTLDRAAAEAATLEARLRLLPAVIGVVDAVAYAHGEGVIHRDLKPQNVLVGSFGEVVVLDWGIARVDADEGLDAINATPGQLSVADTEVTRAGEVLGTLAYMAPEQAAGDPVDARADVFGLGAILYQVITGEMPLAADLERFPELPPELVAIVARAMAPDAAQRYPTAHDLAEDLKRWQAGRMVKAHEYTPGQLVRRWIRKHRTKLAVATAASAVAILLGTIGVWRVVVERRAAETARVRAETQRAAAEELLTFVLGDLRDRLERVGRLDALGGVARAVIGYEERTPPPDDVDGWLQRSSAASLAGDVAHAAAEFVDSEDAYKRALAAAEQAARLAPALPRVAAARCRAHRGIGDARMGRSALAEAGTAFAACAAIAAGSTDPELGEHLIASRTGQAAIAREAGDLAGARRILDDLLPLAQDRARAEGPTGSASADLFALRHDRFDMLSLIGHVPDMVTEADAILALAEARVAARPDDVEVQRELVMARQAIGSAADLAGDDARAEAAYKAALAGAQMIAAREPTNAQWQRDVSSVMDKLGRLALETRRTEEAIRWLEDSAAITERVAALEPANQGWRRDVAVSTLTIGDVLLEVGRYDEARATMLRAIALYERVEGVFARRELGIAFGHLATVELLAGDRRAAARAYERGIELLRAEVDRADTPQTRVELASSMWILAQIEPPAAAREIITEARAVVEPLRAAAAANPNHAELIGKIDVLAAKLAP